MNFLRADWEGFKRETELLLSSLVLPFSCAKGEKEFRKVSATATKHLIPAGYRKDFRGHRIPEAIRFLKEERDSCRVSDAKDPLVKILDDLILRGIRQEAQDQWQSLLDRSDRRTKPTRYWALWCKLSSRRAPQPPNISILFGRSPLSSAKAFTKQFTTVPITGTQALDGGEQRPDNCMKILDTTDPDPPTEDEDITDFITYISSLENTIMTGDVYAPLHTVAFTIRRPHWHTAGRPLAKLSAHHSQHRYPNKKTPACRSATRFLPEISTASRNIASKTTWETLLPLGSDHLPIMISHNVKTKFRIKPHPNSFTNYRKANWEDFRKGNGGCTGKCRDTRQPAHRKQTTHKSNRRSR